MHGHVKCIGIAIILVLILYSCSMGQVDEYGNPVFNSIAFDEDTVSTFILSSSYYSIENNIDNPESSVFVCKSPTSDQIIDFSRQLPSYFFLIANLKREVANMVCMMPQNEGDSICYHYLIINPSNGKSADIACKVGGQFTEARAIEIVNDNYIPGSKISNATGEIIIENKSYSIQSFSQLKDDVIDLIGTYELDKISTNLSKIKEK